jgi:imidazolonepropionase-like amidohydrolase
MTRTLFTNARIFDGTGAPAADGEVVVEGGLIRQVGLGLDGDEVVNLGGRGVLPGLFDCHVHVAFTDVDTWRYVQKPFSLEFFETARNLKATLAGGITTVRDAGGADLGTKEAVEQGLIAGPRMQISLRMISQTGGHGDDWMASGMTPGTPTSPPTS